MMQSLTSNSNRLHSNIPLHAMATRNTSLLGYLTITTLNFGSNFYIKYFSNYMNQSQIQLYYINGNTFSTGVSIINMNTNNQNLHVAYAGGGYIGICLTL